MAKNFYAVKRGLNKETNNPVVDHIFTDWATVKPLVVGYEDARYKGFDTAEEAEAWLKVVDRIDAERRSKKQIENAKKEVGIENKDVHDITNDYIDILNKLIKEYKKNGWTKLSTIGNLTSVLVNETEKIY